jgi:hypothetical protein
MCISQYCTALLLTTLYNLSFFLPFIISNLFCNFIFPICDQNVLSQTNFMKQSTEKFIRSENHKCEILGFHGGEDDYVLLGFGAV